MDKNTQILIGVVVVIVVIALLAYGYISGQSGAALAQSDGQPVTSAQLSQLYSIANNASLAKAVGTGVIGTFPQKVTASPMNVNGKPGVLYIGAEYCPFCAATRWGLVIALMRFGNFSSLHYMTSSSSDVYPSTATFTFYNGSYYSQYVGFVPVEIETNTEQPLQAPNASQNASMHAFNTQGSIPFIDFGNKTVQVGASYSPGLITGKSWSQIIAQLNQPNSTISQAIIGQANVFTAQICAMDNYTPASVCNAPYIKTVLSQSTGTGSGPA